MNVLEWQQAGLEKKFGPKPAKAAPAAHRRATSRESTRTQDSGKSPSKRQLKETVYEPDGTSWKAKDGYRYPCYCKYYYNKEECPNHKQHGKCTLPHLSEKQVMAASKKLNG